jgi:hypothetical protein
MTSSTRWNSSPVRNVQSTGTSIDEGGRVGRAGQPQVELRLHRTREDGDVGGLTDTVATGHGLARPQIAQLADTVEHIFAPGGVPVRCEREVIHTPSGGESDVDPAPGQVVNE